MNFSFKRKDSVKKGASDRKGASRVVSEKSGFELEFNPATILMSIALFVFGIVFYGAFMAVETVLEVPVNQVEVKADLVYQNKEQITEVINGYVVDGFVRVNLQKLQKELIELPWIYHASIKRKLPHGLVVELTEQKPMAYWNDHALINSYGDIFYPEVRPQIAGFPVLTGKDDKRVLEIYTRLQNLLSDNQKPIVAVHVGDRNVVNVVTALDTELIFNGDKIDEQVLLWKHIADTSIKARLAEVKQADMRYSNGAAVQWKEIVALNNETLRGGH